MAADLREPGQLTFRLPQGITVPLRPYQKLGFNWLCTLDYYGLGGILADDMGLGKTLQAIVYIAYNFRKKRKPALVIAPDQPGLQLAGVSLRNSHRACQSW